MARLSHALFASGSQEWETPQALFDALNAEFDFDVDVCATPANAKCEMFWTKEHNALAQWWDPTRGTWHRVYWMNPPYGRALPKWLKKAHETREAGGTVVALVPSRTGTRWWSQYCADAEVRHIVGRLTFQGADRQCPFYSSVVVFRRILRGQVWYIDRQGREVWPSQLRGDAA